MTTDDPISIHEGGDFKTKKQFIIFKNQLDAFTSNNLYILKECRENKRLLDLRYDYLNNRVNHIQMSVIFLSTLSGFLQSTKEFFKTPTPGVSVVGISISTYISLILSVSKYYKLDEKKERIHNLREKYSNLHNKLDYRMDILGPWTNHKLWEHKNPDEKLEEWNKIVQIMEEEYLGLIDIKQLLVLITSFACSVPAIPANVDITPSVSQLLSRSGVSGTKHLKQGVFFLKSKLKI